MYDGKDNPLNGIKVELPKKCRNHSHVQEILLWGVCPTCKSEKLFSLEP